MAATESLFRSLTLLGVLFALEAFAQASGNNETQEENLLRSSLDVVAPVDEAEYDGIEVRMFEFDCPSRVVCGPGEKCTMHLGHPHCFVPTLACRIIPCANGGTCVNDLCQCVSGFTGDHCKKADDNYLSCLPDGCKNGGVCVYLSASATKCQCKPGFTGDDCSQVLTNCNGYACQHNGYCSYLSSVNAYSCVCVGPWQGPDCGTPIQTTCNGYTCLNSGYCSLISNSYRCVCVGSWKGPDCGTPVTPTCNGYTCLNNGYCSLVSNAYKCVCIGSWQGPDCGTPVTATCNGYTCKNGGYCAFISSSYRCVCVDSWSGPDCSTPGVPGDPICSGSPCKGDCLCQESCQHEAGYVCVSGQGYLGRHCTVPVPDLQCNSNEIIVTISNLFYNEWDLGQGNSFIYMSPTVDGTGSTIPECRGRLVGSTYRITLSHPFTQCGTLTSTTNGAVEIGSVVFTNNLWINKNFQSSFDMPFPVIRIQCTYSDMYSVYTSLRPILPDPILISEEMAYRVSSQLCKVSTCNLPCPQNLAMQPSAVYTVGQTLHMGFGIQNLQPVELSSISNAVYIHHITLSCSSSSVLQGTAGAQSLSLNQDGCSTPHGTALDVQIGYSTIQDMRVCMSFRVPRMKTCSEMFIHVRFQICHGTTIQTSCGDGTLVQRCASRKRRDLLDRDQVKPLVVGPIYVLLPEQGVAHRTFLADNVEVAIRSSGNEAVGNATRILEIPKLLIPKTSDDAKNVSSLNLPALISGLCFLFLSFCLGLTFFLCRGRPSNPDCPAL